jgi:tetratricopeptide (TPR) repeat protein
MTHKKNEFDTNKYKAATAVFKLGAKAMESGMHRTLNREPKGKGWVPCKIEPIGLYYKPNKIREAIKYFEIAYSIYPEIITLNQIALCFEIIGEFEQAKLHFKNMQRQAEEEENDAYLQAAKTGLQRCSKLE